MTTPYAPCRPPQEGYSELPQMAHEGGNMSGDRIGEILSELREMRQEGQDTREKVITLIEQAKGIVDHEDRLRSLERWKYGLPVTGLVAIGSMALSAWAKTGGS